MPAPLLLAKSPLRTDRFVLRAVRKASLLGSKEDVRAPSYSSLQLYLCLKLWIKAYLRGLQRIADKFTLCSALIFSDECFLLYQAYGALDFESH